MWLENVELCISQHAAIGTARALIRNAISLHSTKQSFWMRAYKLE
jgi:hypothetical protein